MRTLSLLLTAVLLILSTESRSQGGTSDPRKKKGIIEKRDQAEGWYLPVHGEVTHEQKKAEGVEVKVFKENKDMGAFTTSKSGKFDLELDLDGVYTLYIIKPGYQGKMIMVDTHLPENMVKYPAYDCFINLEPENQTSASDPFYLDFPSAIVRYNAELGGYYHSEAYLEHINNKLHSVAQVKF